MSMKHAERQEASLAVGSGGLAFSPTIRHSAALDGSGSLSRRPRGSTMALSRSMLGLLTAAVIGGCAHVNSYKVDSDGKRLKGVEEGIPYYQPRPYVAVKSPFPVSGGDLLVQGTVDSEGNVLIPKDAVPDRLKTWFRTSDVDANSLVVPGETVVRVRQQSTRADKDGGDGNGDDGNDDDGDGGGGAGGAGSGGPSAKPPGEDDKKKEEAGGKNEMSGPAASHVVRVCDSFDVVYLPDFAERYVLQLNPGLGNLKATINLQGGMLNSFGTEIDNSAVASMVSQAVAAAVDVAKQYALAGLAPDEPTETLDEAIRQQSTAKSRKATLRIRCVAEALPGLYPILKPGEEAPGNQELLLPSRITFRARQRVEVEVVRVEASASTPPPTPTAKRIELSKEEVSKLWDSIKQILGDDQDLLKSIGELRTAYVPSDKKLILRFGKEFDAETASKVRKKLEAAKGKLAIDPAIIVEGGAGD